jgi:serine phosphatase RsbU (regulator of sigma subunit)
VTVAPPLSRSHLFSALLSAALLCALFACPGLAKQPGNTPPGQAKKAARANGGSGKVPPGQAKKAARQTNGAGANASAPGQAKKAARANGGSGTVPPGQVKKAARASGGFGSAPPGQAKKAASQGGGGPATGAGGQASGGTRNSAARTRRTVRARAAARRRARAARLSSLARRRAAAAAAPARRAAVAAATRAVAAGAATTGASAQASGGNGAKKKSSARSNPTTANPRDKLPQPFRVVRDIVHVVPTPLRILVAGLVALAILLAGAAGFTLLRNQRLARQRAELLGQVGLLQAALLPEVPERLGPLAAFAAYRPAEGPAAGGDFYDVVPLAAGQTAVIIGDVSGHGREALARTALARYTLRAYVEAGMEPAETLQIAGSVLAGKLEGDFVTALVAVHDAGAGTLTYASAGHPPPIVVAGAAFKPVLVASAPPLGIGAATGQRQTTVPFPRGAIACFYTDGLSEARMASGRLVGAAGLERVVRTLGPDITAAGVIESVAATARRIGDDAAAVVVAAADGSAIVRARVERLDLSRAELRGPLLRRFLDACGVSPHAVRAAERTAREIAREAGGAVVEVRMGDTRSDVDVRRPDLPQREIALSGVDRL